MKLRTKIQIFASVALFIVILLINVAIFFLFQKISLEAEVERVREEANVIMEALASSMESEVNPNALLKAYIPTNGMVRIINSEEVALQSITKNSDYYQVPVQYVTTETREIFRGNDDAPFVVISTPFIWEDGQVVTLQVSEHLASQKETLNTLFIVLLVASLIMIIPALIGGWALSKFLLKPIMAIIQAMTENPKNGKWTKIEATGKSKDELYQLGNTYNEMIDRLQESLKKQEQFVSDASHELKTPISVIKSYADLLERWGKEKQDVYEEAIDAIKQEAVRMESMTKQMLTLAKNQKEDHLQFETVHLPKLVQEVVRAFTVTYKRKITFASDVEEPMISCDKEKINQVLYILLDNAHKYSDGGIDVRITQRDPYIEIAIRDHGEGISEEDIRHIFDRFYRVDKARSRETGGTGLGLSIAQIIVEAHNGEIDVESTVGQGTTFTVKLPY